MARIPSTRSHRRGRDRWLLVAGRPERSGGLRSASQPAHKLVELIEGMALTKPRLSVATIHRRDGTSHRGRRVGRTYINVVLIPLLCRKAGVPLEDARGRITSHRARATIATQLNNAKEPMSLSELQELLGHRSSESTRHYAKRGDAAADWRRVVRRRLCRTLGGRSRNRLRCRQQNPRQETEFLPCLNGLPVAMDQ